jgi:hypothetical protein
MAIVQISKIIHRVGAQSDLPQLDVGEIGFASDTQQVYIGNDPILVPVPDGSTTTQTEILTEASEIAFTQIMGSSNTSVSLSDPRSGEILVLDGNASVGTTWTNWDGTLLGPSNNIKLKLGNVSNISILGGMPGGVLTTDGSGSLSWATSSSGGVGIANAVGWLHNDGSGTLVWSSPTNVYYGTSNVAVINNSNVTVSVGGTANIATFTSTGINLKYANTTTANLGNVVTANYITGTLTTAAQPNITSTGTLANLTVSGNATVGTLIVTVATAPTHSYGAAGDKKGTIAFSQTYMYYCKADYVDNLTDIWTRIQLDSTSF